MQSVMVKTRVGELFVAESGNPEGPPVLLWPSLYCTGAVFAEQQRFLAPAHRVLTLDPPGHGRSGPVPPRFSLEDTAEATCAVLDAFGIEEVAIVGGAWGGMVGVQLAATAPGRVSKVVLINSPMDRWRGRQRAEMVALAALLKVGGPKAAAVVLVPNMVSKATRVRNPTLVEELREMFRSLDRTNLFRAARSAMLDRPSLLPLLGDLEVPVLVIVGSADALVPVERARAEAMKIPDSRFEVVAETAHLSAYEAPAAVNELLAAFLAAADLPPG